MPRAAGRLLEMASGRGLEDEVSPSVVAQVGCFTFLGGVFLFFLFGGEGFYWWFEFECVVFCLF